MKPWARPRSKISQTKKIDWVLEGGIMGPYSVKWLDAIKFEIESMYENQVWNFVTLPEDMKPIEYK
jgi:hypothetical protein